MQQSKNEVTIESLKKEPGREIKSKAIDYLHLAEEVVFDEKDTKSAIPHIEAAKEFLSQYTPKNKFLKSWSEFDIEMLRGAIHYIESKVAYRSGDIKEGIRLVEKSISHLTTTYLDSESLNLMEEDYNVSHVFFKMDSALWLGKALKFRSRIEKEQEGEEIAHYLKKAEKLFKKVIKTPNYDVGSSPIAEACYHLSSIKIKKGVGNLEEFISAYKILEETIPSIEKTDDYYKRLLEFREGIIEKSVHASLLEDFSKESKYSNRKEFKRTDIETSFIQDERIFFFYIN